MNINTLFNGEPSMDNPVVEQFPHLNIGDTFTFKGERLQVKHLSKSKNGFWYINHGTLEEGYMSFEFYMSTPSAMGRKL